MEDIFPSRIPVSEEGLEAAKTLLLEADEDQVNSSQARREQEQEHVFSPKQAGPAKQLDAAWFSPSSLCFDSCRLPPPYGQILWPTITTITSFQCRFSKAQVRCQFTEGLHEEAAIFHASVEDLGRNQGSRTAKGLDKGNRRTGEGEDD